MEESRLQDAQLLNKSKIARAMNFKKNFTRPIAFSLAHFSVIVIFTFEDISFMLIMILALIAISIES